MGKLLRFTSEFYALARFYALRATGKLATGVLTRFRRKTVKMVPVSAASDGRRRQRRNKRDAKQFRRLLDKVFDDFILTRSESRKSARAIRRLPPIDPALCETFSSRLYEIESLDQLLWAEPDCPTELKVKGLRGCTLHHVNEDDAPHSSVIPGQWYCHEMESVGIRALRGKSAIVMPYVVRSTSTWKGRRGQLTNWENLLVSPNGRNWRLLSYRSGRLIEDSKFEKILRMQMSMQLTREASWSMIIERRGVSMRIQTDATGIRELLMLRDFDGQRRVAARHWVTDHTRRLAGGKQVKVKAHLRGATDFRWRSWTISVHPSQHDLAHLDSQNCLPSTDLIEILDANLGLGGFLQKPKAEAA